MNLITAISVLTAMLDDTDLKVTIGTRTAQGWMMTEKRREVLRMARAALSNLSNQGMMEMTPATIAQLQKGHTFD